MWMRGCNVKSTNKLAVERFERWQGEVTHPIIRIDRAWGWPDYFALAVAVGCSVGWILWALLGPFGWSLNP